jgi:hypothetical protein
MILDVAYPDDGWKRGPPMTNSRCNPHTMILDGKLYVLGGFSDFGPKVVDYMEVYDPRLRKWESLPNPPFDFEQFNVEKFITSSLVETKKEIIVAKQCIEDKKAAYSYNVYSYNVMTRCWKTLEPSVRDLRERVVTVGNTLYWVGFL